MAAFNLSIIFNDNVTQINLYSTSVFTYEKAVSRVVRAGMRSVQRYYLGLPYHGISEGTSV